MVLDPYGEVLSEIKSFDDDFTISKITKDKLQLSGGWRYKNARRPELYREIIGRAHQSDTTPVWMKGNK